MRSMPDRGPVVMVNLVRLRDRSADGNGSGWDAYLRYSAATMPLIKALGDDDFARVREREPAPGKRGRGSRHPCLHANLFKIPCRVGLPGEVAHSRCYPENEGAMSESAKKKPVSRKRAVPASNGHGKAMNEKQSPSAKEQLDDSEAIERAVYDGMQDLRVKKTR